MTIEKEPFRAYNTETPEHELKYGRPISLRLNEEEMEMLDQDKKALGIDRDSTAVKILMMWGRNVLHNLYMPSEKEPSFLNNSLPFKNQGQKKKGNK